MARAHAREIWLLWDQDLRFDGIERFVHWLTGVSFVIRYYRPQHHLRAKPAAALDGATGIQCLDPMGKFAHNFLSFAFTIGVVLMFLMWIGRNFPTAADIEWVKMAGGMFDKVTAPHPPTSSMQGKS